MKQLYGLDIVPVVYKEMCEICNEASVAFHHENINIRTKVYLCLHCIGNLKRMLGEQNIARGDVNE